MTDQPSHLWLNPCFGASGDMMLGALAGVLGSTAPLEALDALGLEPGSFSLRSSIVDRNGLACQRVEVTATPSRVRRWQEIDQLLADAPIDPVAKAGARATFRRLGDVEAAQHGVPIDEVHFHEVGAIDAIIDITGAWLLLAALGRPTVCVGPVGLGHGTVRAAHGILPLPAPATVELLAGAQTRPLDVEAETCTPTGAALLAEMADEWGPLPGGTIVAQARGAGGRNPDSHPNALTAITVDGSTAEGHESAVIIETNLDDVTPEVLAFVVERLLEEGAADAWLVPIVMKKGRAAHELRVLCTPADVAALRAIISAETQSMGTRVVAATKYPLARRFADVTVRGETISVKIGPHGAKPEFDQLAALSRSTGVPIRVLAAEALAALGAETPMEEM